MAPTVAITGCTGFIGQHLVTALLERGYGLRLLLRRHGCAVAGEERVERIDGSLEDRASLDALTNGADIVVHLAGAIWAPSLQEFLETNREGTRRISEATAASGAGRMILVSSLAAREPEISAYAASKRAAEIVARQILDNRVLTILRPPAVYGPGDKATLQVFRQLRRGFLLTPRGNSARFSLIYVDDLIDLLVRLVAGNDINLDVIEPDDGTAGGYDWRRFRDMAAAGLQRRVRRIAIPRMALSGPARLCDGLSRLMGRPVGLGSGKLRELFHEDWVARGDRPLGWQPTVCFDAGVARTMSWYSARGWL